ncbi:unnamed protein product [Linum tenue]|uniref:Uncharacterized protein n=1 Tax=Linum tenue TaxID=586396 RepID=A0AAV0PRM7_9ROSI|nr:unnamed protein product [Linum tenue]
MFRARHALARLKHRRLCTTTAKPNHNNKKSYDSGGNNGGDNNKQPSSITRYNETYSQLGKLDFMTAAKILFAETPKQKKFGLDFHLVQLFFVCLPSLAVYLVAMYARREMERVETEFQQKKKKEEETRAEEEEQKALEVEAKSNAAISEVKERVDKLEVALNEIVVDKKKDSSSGSSSSSSTNVAKRLSPIDPSQERFGSGKKS